MRSILIRFLKSLKKNKSLVPLAITLLACVAIWYYGSIIKFGDFQPLRPVANRLWLIAVVLGLWVLWGIWKLISVWRSRRTEKVEKVPDPTDIAMGKLTKSFSEAIEIMRLNWEGDNKKLRYGLPWYLVLGMPDSGKTSLMLNSNLRFPLSHIFNADKSNVDRYKKEQYVGSDIVDWRVTDEAVFLDIDGKLMTSEDSKSGESGHKVEGEDEVNNEASTVPVSKHALWHHLLKLIKGFRPRRPINGVVLVVDVVTLAAMNGEQIVAYANQFRGRIHHLIEDLGTRFTTYVVFTKIDRLKGFEEFFQQMELFTKEEPLGFQFSNNTINENSTWVEEYDSAYKAFIANLNHDIFRKLNDLHDTKARQEAYSFVRHFAGMEPIFREFLTDTFGPDNYSCPPLLRGIYFTSVRQENPPVSPFVNALNEHYSIPKPIYGVPKSISRPYFSNRLFSKLILPEAGLAKNSKRQDERLVSRNRVLTLAGAIVCAVAAGFWFGEQQSNLDNAQLVKQKVEQYESKHVESVDNFGVKLLPKLNPIREATFAFGDYRDWSDLNAFISLYQGKKVGPVADAKYLEILEDDFVPSLISGIENEIQISCYDDTEYLLELLRVYLLLGDKEYRHGIDGDPSFSKRDEGDLIVRKHFKKQWSRKLEGFRREQNGLNAHLQYALMHANSDPKLNNVLISETRQHLGFETPYNRFYQVIKNKAERQLPNPLNFRSVLGASFDIVYNDPGVIEYDNEVARPNSNFFKASSCNREALGISPLEIMRLYTRQYYFDFFLSENKGIEEIAVIDLSVLGESNKTVSQYSEEDYDAIKQRVHAIYISEYINAWRRALNSLHIRDFENLQGATRILEQITGPARPIGRLLDTVKTNTTIYPTIVESFEPAEGSDTKDLVDAKLKSGNLSKLGNALGDDKHRATGLRINRAFAPLHRLVETDKEGIPSDLEEIDESLRALYQYISNVQNSPQRTKEALVRAKQRITLEGEDPIYTVRRIGSGAPAPLNAHLRKIADESWRVLLDAATYELEKQWKRDVYGYYQAKIAGQFPFNPESKEDLPLNDFKMFFGPDGILETFFKEHIVKFVDENSGEPRIIDGQKLEISPAFTESLLAARRVSEIFFDESGNVAVDFTLLPINMSGSIGRGVLNIEGQIVAHTHGPANPIKIVWPNIIGTNVSSRIDLMPIQGGLRTSSLEFKGPWSWLRMYRSANKSNFSDTSVDLTFQLTKNRKITYRLREENKVNPFFNSPLSNFRLVSEMRKIILDKKSIKVTKLSPLPKW